LEATFPKFVLRFRRSHGTSQYDYDTLDIQAQDAADIEDLYKSAQGVQELAHFFGSSDVQAAVKKVEQQFGPTTVVKSETPNCEVCGGPTKSKRVETKYGQKTVFECLQSNGECLNAKGYPNSQFAKKGRDA